MKRGGALTRHAMPARTTPMPASTVPLVRGPWLSSRSGGSKPRPNAGHPRSQHTGFSASVKLGTRSRAGSGEPERALAECCGIWLGRYGGDIQHIIARGMGGTSDPLIDSIVNAALMCRPHHDLAEARDPELLERGFWRHSWETPGACPLMLHGRDGGFTRWLDSRGGYSATPPSEAPEDGGHDAA
jgi:hypothetical protein